MMPRPVLSSDVGLPISCLARNPTITNDVPCGGIVGQDAELELSHA